MIQQGNIYWQLSCQKKMEEEEEKEKKEETEKKEGKAVIAMGH